MGKSDLTEAKTQLDTSLESYLVNKYASQFKIIKQVSEIIGSDEEPEDILKSVLNLLLQSFSYHSAQIYQLSTSGTLLWLYLEQGSGADLDTQYRDVFSIEDENIIGDALRNNGPIYVSNIHQEPYSYGRSNVDPDIGSELAVPLNFGNASLGVLRIQSSKVDDFDEADISFLSTLSSSLASFIKNSRTIQQLTDKLQEIKILYDLQLNEKRNQQVSTSNSEIQGYQYNRTAIETTESDDLSASARSTLSGENVGISASQAKDLGELIAPIELHGKTIGVLGVEDVTQTAKWSNDDIRLLEEVSSQVALAIENSRLLQQAQERTKELSILFDNSRQLSETIELRQIYEILIVQIINYLNADICCLSILNEAKTHFEEIVTKFKNRDQTGRVIDTKHSKTRLEAIEDSPTLQQLLKHPDLIIQHPMDPTFPFLYTSDKPIAAVEIEGDSNSKLETGSNGSGIHTLATFPVIVRSNLVGIVKVAHFRQQRNYSQDEIRLTQAIIAQVTVAIENAQLFERTQNTLAETQRLYDISRSLVESTTFEEIFDVIIGNVKFYDVDRVSISLLDRAQSGKIEGVTIVASWNRDSNDPFPVGTKISPDLFPLAEAFAQPPYDPLISEDLSQAEGQDERIDEAFRQFMYEKIRCTTLFSTPMFLGPEYKGVLSISTKSPHIYSQQEMRIYQTLADQAIIAIERQGLLETTRRERDRAALLYELGQTLSHTITVDEVNEIVLKFTERVGAEHGEIYITDGSDFICMASTIPERQDLLPDEMSALAKTVLSEGLEAQALIMKKPVIKNRSQEDWDVEGVPDPVGMKSLICIPFQSQRGGLQGVLTYFHTKENVFDEDPISLFESIAIQTSTSLENVWLLQQTADALGETELLYNATRDFNSAQHVEDLLAALAESIAIPQARIETNIDHMSIALITALEEDGSPKELNIVAEWDIGTEHLQRASVSGERIVVTNPELQITSEEYPFIKQLTANMPQEIQLDHIERLSTSEYSYLGKAHSLMSVPLVVGNNWLGALFIASLTKEYSFKSDIISQISTLAGQVAVVIQNLQLVEETQQNLYNSEILSHLSQELLIADTAEAIYSLCLDAIAATEPERGAAILMYDQLESELQLEIVALWDNPSQEWPNITPGVRFSADDLGLGPLMKTGQTVISSHAIGDKRFSEQLQQLLEMMQIQSLAAVPIWLNKEVNGFVLIGNQKAATFSSDIIRLYENIGRLTSGALENRRLFEEAKYRATLLQTASEVSQAATSYLDLDSLLSQSVDLIRDRFGFYHVSIFLVDDYQQFAIVEASTGEIGQKMLATKHKLEVGGKSIVGTATATGKPRIALDVGKDAVHFNNPLLPYTRSEMALPLIARGQVIGALDVQSTEKGAFSESDITILQSMANQLANAIEAALTFQASQEALEDLSKLQEYYLRDEWSTFLREQKAATSYRLTEDGFIVAQTEPPLPGGYQNVLLDEAIEAKQPTIVQRVTSSVDKRGHDVIEILVKATDESKADTPLPPAADSENTATLVAPLTLHGQVAIGAVDFEIPYNYKIKDKDTLEIVEAIANQAAQAIEAARLFEQTQAAREEAEALYDVGRTLVSTETEQEMFHTVLRKMLSTLGLKQGGILLFDKDRKFGQLFALFQNGEPVEPNIRFPIKGNPSYEKLLETKQAVVIEDYANDPIVAPARKANPDLKIASLLLVPITIYDEVVGAMGADSVDQIHAFTKREINLVSAMADQLSVMLQNRRLLEETRRRAIQLRTSSDVGRVATSILDQNIMLGEAVELIRDRFGFYHAQIFLIDVANQCAVLHKSTGEAGQKLLADNHKVAIGETSIIGQVTHQRKSIVIRDTELEDSEFVYHTTEFLPDTRAELAIPLQVGDTLIGVLDVHSTSPDDFTKEDIDTMETLAAQLAIAIQNARIFREQQETAERLKEIDKLKTQFLANMSHELRTPLNSIIGFSRVILKGIDGPLTELQKADLTSIHNSGQHLLGLINNILDLSKIGAGKMELNFEETEIGPIIKGVMSTAMALVKDKPVELLQDVPGDLPIVWADPTRLRQIILNLVSNACKFTDQGAVTLQVTAEKEKVIISVSDTGIGIPEDNLDSIFEEFTQVDSSTTRKVGGTGLGLPISRHFVEMHKGQIWLESNPGKGSTFSFAIPIKPASEEPIGSENVSEDKEVEVIVAIDGDPGVINLYERFLEKQHYRIIGIDNGSNITNQVKMHNPSVILLDVLMPNKDGWSILKDLKNNSLTKNIPIIICSIVNDKNRAFSLGASDYLVKPIVKSELVNALKHLDDQQKEQVKVLVIDDQADDILLIRRILEAHSNYKIFEASNGKEGLELVNRHNPDLIILDLSMPEMDGFAVVEALKIDEKTCTKPIIIVSAKDLTSTEHKRLTGQVEVFLRKGIFTESELLEDVSQALGQLQKQEVF